jgi:hypothetical protein
MAGGSLCSSTTLLKLCVLENAQWCQPKERRLVSKVAVFHA